MWYAAIMDSELVTLLDQADAAIDESRRQLECASRQIALARRRVLLTAALLEEDRIAQNALFDARLQSRWDRERHT
jgi:hypothetical protein